MGRDADVIVAGAGAAGLVAALAAAERGARVILLDRERNPGGNTALSSAMIMAAGTRLQRTAGIEEGPEDLYQDIMRRNKGQSDPEVTRALCEVAPVLVEWLIDYCGVPLRFVDDFAYPGHSRCRFHAPPDRTGRELVDGLLRRIQEEPGILFVTEVTVEQLIQDERSGIAGVVARAGEREELRAASVILATGGFGANRALLREYIPDMATAFYYGSHTNLGDAVRMGRAVGAELAHMGAFQGHGLVTHPYGLPINWAGVVHGAFLVNLDGRRFVNEDVGPSSVARYVLAQPQGLACIIMDEYVVAHLRRFREFRELEGEGALRGPCRDAVELAHALRIDAAGLADELGAYQTAFGSSGGVDRMGRTSGRALSPPLYGARVQGALYHTQGGLRVNAKAQVLRPGKVPIPGLFAAGGAAAGISGDGPDGYLPGNGLLSALGLGFIAGREAAARAAV